MAETKKYWMGTLSSKDDFGVEIGDTFYDGKTRAGPWAIMTPKSWHANGVGRTGTGLAQRYERQPDGKWLKVEG